jgi:hypothetical protein
MSNTINAADLNRMIADACGIAVPNLEWELDADTDGGWVVEWTLDAAASEVKRYLAAHYSVDTSVSHDGGKTWLWVAPK